MRVLPVNNTCVVLKLCTRTDKISACTHPAAILMQYTQSAKVCGREKTWWVPDLKVSWALWRNFLAVALQCVSWWISVWLVTKIDITHNGQHFLVFADIGATDASQNSSNHTESYSRFNHLTYIPWRRVKWKVYCPVTKKDLKAQRFNAGLPAVRATPVSVEPCIC